MFNIHLLQILTFMLAEVIISLVVAPTLCDDGVVDRWEVVTPILCDDGVVDRWEVVTPTLCDDGVVDRWEVVGPTLWEIRNKK